MSDMPPPSSDWICQRDLAKLFGIVERTATIWAKAGRLRQYEHGIDNCGRRKYSRTLVDNDMQRQWGRAVRRQAELLDKVEQQSKGAG